MPSKVNLLLVPLKDTSLTSSLFQHHLLNIKKNKPQLHFTNYDYTVTGILFFLLILFVWLYVSNRKRLTQVIKGFYINRYSNQLAREEASLGNTGSLFLSTLFIVSLTLFISQVCQYYGISSPVNSLFLFLIIAASILLIYTIKLISVKFVGFVFKLPGKQTIMLRQYFYLAIR